MLEALLEIEECFCEAIFDDSYLFQMTLELGWLKSSLRDYSVILPGWNMGILEGGGEALARKIPACRESIETVRKILKTQKAK